LAITSLVNGFDMKTGAKTNPISNGPVIIHFVGINTQINAEITRIDSIAVVYPVPIETLVPLFAAGDILISTDWYQVLVTKYFPFFFCFISAANSDFNHSAVS